MGDIDWSQYEAKSTGSQIPSSPLNQPKSDQQGAMDWSQYEQPSNESEISSSPFNKIDSPQEPQGQQSSDQNIKPEGFKELTRDALSSLQELLGAPKRMAIGAYKFGKRIPENLQGIAEEFKNNPIAEFNHIVEQAGVGGVEGIKGIANLAALPYSNLSKLYGKISGKKTPSIQIPETTGLQKALRLDSNKKGDELIKVLPDIVMGGKALVDLGRLGKHWLTKGAEKSEEELLRNKMQEAIISAQKEHKSALKEVKETENNLSNKYSNEHGEKLGTVTPSALQDNINIKQHEKSRLNEWAHVPEEKVPEVAGKPDVKAAENALSNALESTDKHAVHGGRAYQDAIMQDKEATVDLYNKYDEHLRQHDIPVHSDADIKKASDELQAMKDADELAPGYGIGSDEQISLEKNLDKLQSETINARDIFSVKRTLDQMAGKVRAKQFSGVSENEFKALRSVADKLELHSDSLGKILERVGGPEATKIIKLANKGWSKYSAVRGHTTGRHLLEKGTLPSNTIGKLQERSVYPNQQRAIDYLNEIKDQSPSLQKNILSQTYGSPSKYQDLLKNVEEVRPYLNKRDDLHPHIETLRETKHAEAEHQRLANSMKEIAKVQQKRTTALAEQKTLDKRIKFLENAIPIIDKKIKAAEAKGENTAKLKEDKARHIREHVEKKTKLDAIKKHLIKLTVGKGAYAIIVPKNKGVNTNSYSEE